MSFWATVGDKFRIGWAAAGEWRVVQGTFNILRALKSWWTGDDERIEQDRTEQDGDAWPEEGVDPLTPVAAAVAPDGDGAPGQEHARRAAGLNLCIDLGTFASTVARERDGNVELAVLHYQSQPPGWSPAYEIRSAALWIDDRPFMDPLTFAEMAAAHAEAEVTRSFKRLLFEYVWFEHNPRNAERLTAMYEELFLLALDPQKSSTVQLLEASLAGGPDLTAERGSRHERVRLWKQYGGLPNLDRERQLQESIMAGARLRLCVPNSFDAQSVTVATGRLSAAFMNVVRKMFPPLATQCPPPEVSIVREAEAVTWCIENAGLQPSQALVLDIGAGTTDAALVRLGRERRHGAQTGLKVLYRTGVPFGGDDIDLILLSTAHERRDGIEPLLSMPRKTKLEFASRTRLSKEEWSAGKTLTAEEVDFLRRALEQPARESLPEADLGAAEGLFSPVYGESDGQESTLEMGHPFLIPAYINFLRLAVIATCEPLLQNANGGISRVLLSGAASYTPGVAVALQAVLERYGCSASIERVADLLARRPGLERIPPVRRAKLACVYGGANSLPFRSTFDREFLPESLRLEIRTSAPSLDEYDLFAVGERLQDGRLLAFYTIDDRGDHVFTVRRYFTPHEFIDEQYRSSSWVRRFVGRAELPAEAVKLVLQLIENEEGVSDLQAWTAYTVDPNRLIPLQLVSPTEQGLTREISPLTGLPLEWLWDENDG